MVLLRGQEELLALLVVVTGEKIADALCAEVWRRLSDIWRTGNQLGLLLLQAGKLNLENELLVLRVHLLNPALERVVLVDLLVEHQGDLIYLKIESQRPGSESLPNCIHREQTHLKKSNLVLNRNQNKTAELVRNAYLVLQLFIRFLQVVYFTREDVELGFLLQAALFCRFPVLLEPVMLMEA